MAELGDYIDELFGHLTLDELSSRTGVGSTALSRMKNGYPPTPVNALRVAAAARVSPARIHELAGHPELAALYRRIFPDQGPERGHGELHLLERFQRLLDTGGHEQLLDVLKRAESERWGALRKALDKMTERVRARAAAFLVERNQHRRAVAWNCKPALLEALELSPEDCRGWVFHRSESFSGAVLLGLDHPERPVRDLIHAFTEVWAVSLVD